MKSISKYFAFAAAMTALASCSDDLGLGSNGLQNKAVVTLQTCEEGDAFTRMAAKEKGGDVYGGEKSIVWATGDKIRVFTLDKLSQDIYQLASGAGKTEGVFVRTQETGLIGDKYAITEADMVYGISAAEIDGEILPRLTLTLPHEFTPGKNEDGNQKFPVPYWGAAEVSEGAEEATVSASLSGMTAYLRINIGELPAGTKSIVLTTHGGGIFKPEEGFILAPFGKNVDDTKAGWYNTFVAGGDPANLPEGHEWIMGGYSEALTGTLNTILQPGCELAIDERLVHSDEMIINLPNVKNQIIYVPIVCGDYRNLHVIAASKVSENYRYCYAGTELKVFQDATFIRNKMYYLNLSVAELGDACIGEVNKAIATLNKTKGMTTIINVDKLYYGANTVHNANNGHKGYTDDQIEFAGEGNVILNIKEVGANQDLGEAENDPLMIVDVLELLGATEVPKDAKGNNRYLEVNLPDKINNAYGYYDITTPLSDLYLGTIDGVQAANLKINVNGSNTMFKQYEDMSIIARNATMQHEEYAAVNIKNGFDWIVISEDTKGDAYVYTDGLQAEEETEINTLQVSSKGQQGFRFDDALIADLWFDVANATGDRQVFTTGSTAIKKISNGPQRQAFDASNPTGANTPSRVHMYALWTGKALTEYAILNGYDVKEVWTAAQLSSIGEGIYPATFEEDLANVYAPGKDQADVLADLQALLGAGTLPQVSEYWIPTQLVRLVWLGDDIYPWMGARVRAQNFKLHGEKVELKNMNFLAKWPNGYDMITDDPHWCCTSCWTPDVTEKYLNLSNFVGLMRFIVNTSTVLVEDIDLNDVELSTPLKALQEQGKIDVNFMGSITGAVASKKTTFQNNHVGEVKIATFGDFVGGMVGAFINFGTATTDSLIIFNNDIEGHAQNVDGGIVGGNQVGGLAGYIYASGGLAQLNNNTVRLDYAILAAEDNAGGLVGALAHKDYNVEATDNKVLMGLPNNIAAIYAGNQYAGGLFGRVGLNDYTKYLQIKSADVYVSGTIRAENGYVGGEVGQMYSGNTYVGVRSLAGLDLVKRDYITNIDVNTLAGKYAVGGLVGNNTQSQKCPMFVITGFAPSEKYECTINITIDTFKNTKTVDDFAQDENEYFGTMSNVLGLMHADLTIVEDNLNVVDHLQSEMKEDVLYKYHWDNTHTVADIQNQKYWGDGNGYVGWRAVGDYKLNGQKLPGEVIDPYDIKCFNVFKTPARYGEKSKNAVE